MLETTKKTGEVKTLSIIIPAYNEEKTIAELIGRVQQADIGSITKEIIVVDGEGSVGKVTKKIIKKISNS